MTNGGWGSFSEPGGVILLALVLGGISPFVGWRALSGAWRSGVLAGAAPRQISRRNTWPFAFLCFGVSGLALSAGIFLDQFGYDEDKDILWKGPFWIPWAGLLLSLVWWPKSLAPRWYRTWCDAGGKRDVMPFTLEDVERIEALPEGRRRERYSRNLNVCRGYLNG